MKLEADHFYKTRDGSKAYVGFIRTDPCMYPAVGIYKGRVTEWALNDFDGANDDDDIVAEWFDVVPAAVPPAPTETLTKRELIAARVLQGLLSSNQRSGVVEVAVLYADALLKRLEQTP